MFLVSYAHTCGVYFTSKKGMALYLQVHSLVIFPNQQSSFCLVFFLAMWYSPEEGTVFIQSLSWVLLLQAKPQQV